MFLSLIVKCRAQTDYPTTTPDNPLPFSSACAGSTVTFNAVLQDDGRQSGKYVVYLINGSTAITYFNDKGQYTGTVTTRAAGVYSATNKATFTVTLPSNLTPSGGYYFQIYSQTTKDGKVYVNNSGTFTVKGLPTATVSGNAAIAYSQSASVDLKFTGDGPWTYEYKDFSTNQWVSFISTTNTATIPFKFTASGTYSGSDLIRNLKNSCGSGTVSGSVSITINPLEIKTMIVTPNVLCPTNEKLSVSFTFNGTPPAGTNFLVQLSDENGNFQAINTDPLNGNVIGQGTQTPIGCSGRPLTAKVASPNYKIRVIAENNSVQPATSGSIVLRRPSPPTVPAPIEYCQNNPVSSLKINGDIMWYGIYKDVHDEAHRQAWNNKNVPTPPTQPGNYWYQLTGFDSGGCESDVVELIVKVTSKSNPPSVADVTFCKNDQPKLLAASSGQSLIWYDGNDNPLGQAPTPSTSTAGVQTYKVAQGGGCPSDKATIKVIVNDLPSPPTVSSPTAICQFADAPVLSATGSGTLHWFDSNGNALPGAPKPNTQIEGSVTYLVSQNVNNCESATKTTITQQIKKASDPPMVSSILYCRNQTATALTAIGENLSWYDANDNPITDITPKTAQTGSTTYKVRQTTTANGCPSPPASLVVTVQDAPGPPKITAVSACLNKAAPSLDASVTGSSLTWYTSVSGGTGATVAPIISTSTAGNQSVFVSQKTGTCEGPRAELKIIVYANPLAPVASVSGPVCQTTSQPIGPFTANADPGGSLTWYWSDQLGGAPQPPTTSATAQPGTYTVAVAQTVNGCISTTTTVSQTISKAPEAPLGTNLLLCVKDIARPLSATPVSGNTLRWYGQNATGGTASTQPPQATLDRAKTETYYVSQVDSKGCESLTRLAIQLRVAEAPPAPTLPSVTTACQYSTPVSLTAGATASLIWKGTDIQDTTKAPTPSTTEGRVYSYTISQKLGTCISPTNQFAYTIWAAPPVPSAQPTYQICIGQTRSLSATASAAGNTLKWYASSTDLANHQNSLSQVNIPTQQAATLSWYVTQTDLHTCESKEAQQTVTISPQASAQLTGDGQVAYDDNLHSQDSTAIRIRLSGAGPWQVTFWDDKTQSVSLTENPVVKWVRLKDLAGLATTPVGSATTVSFALKALSGQCGDGILPAAYVLNVGKLVTAVDPLLGDLSLALSPNPVSGELTLKWVAQARGKVHLQVLSVGGLVLWQGDRVGTGVEQLERLMVGWWPAGTYVVQLVQESATPLVRKLIKL
jgi:hypothetical protein